MIRSNILAAVGAALLALLGQLSVAHAHGRLKSSSPTDGAILTAAPQTLRLEFSEGIELKLSSVTVRGPEKTKVGTNAAVYAAGTDKAIEVALPAALTAGAYSVEWRILSKDGHKAKGTFTFTLKP